MSTETYATVVDAYPRAERVVLKLKGKAARVEAFGIRVGSA